MANPFADVLRGYADLGSTLIQKWGEHASGVASRVGSGGPYGPDCASADLAKTAMLAADSGMLMASEALDCFAMLTDRSARLMNLSDYGIKVGNPADIVVLDATTPEQAVAEICDPLAVFKRGRRTVTRTRAELHRP